MKKLWNNRKLLYTYITIVSMVIVLTLGANQGVNAMSDQVVHYQTVIIDAGHGGVDGGAVSCTGVYESNINLEIALKLNELMHLFGVRTVMIRTTDKSVYTEGGSIASKKVSDIRERVRIANTTPQALYLSIHQNYYSDSRYWGSQVFYNNAPGSQELAQQLQDNLRTYLSVENKRMIKKSSGVYLMEHITCPGILLECGFLSNPSEEKLLRSNEYQQKLCMVIAATVAQHLST